MKLIKAWYPLGDKRRLKAIKGDQKKKKDRKATKGDKRQQKAIKGNKRRLKVTENARFLMKHVQCDKKNVIYKKLHKK